MKRLIILIAMGVLQFSCKAQTEIDPISKTSKEKAEIVLEKIGDMPYSSRLIYSLNDKDFYLVLKNNNDYKEYYVVLDDNDIDEIRLLKTKEKDEMLLSNAFQLEKYHTNFITKIPNAKYVRGNKSYFVIMDNSGKKYGEYSLAALTLPLPIDGALAGYLIRRLGEESAH